MCMPVRIGGTHLAKPDDVTCGRPAAWTLRSGHIIRGKEDNRELGEPDGHPGRLPESQDRGERPLQYDWYVSDFDSHTVSLYTCDSPYASVYTDVHCTMCCFQQAEDL